MRYGLIIIENAFLNLNLESIYFSFGVQDTLLQGLSMFFYEFDIFFFSLSAPPRSLTILSFLDLFGGKAEITEAWLYLLGGDSFIWLQLSDFFDIFVFIRCLRLPLTIYD
jgi:hypothetical protein